MTRLQTLLAATALGLAACQPAAQTETALPAQTAIDFDTVPHAQLPEIVRPTEYVVALTMDPQAVGMSGTVEIGTQVLVETSKIWLHAKEMTVSSAAITYADGTVYDLTFTAIDPAEAPSGIAHLTSEKTLPKGKATIRLAFETPYNQSLNSAYQVRRGDEAYIVTQFEPLGAREAFPSFDEPKYKVPFTLSITAPSDEFVFANTPEIGTDEMEIDGRSWTKHSFAKTRPLPTYLIAFGAGPYDVVEGEDIPPNSVRSRSIELRGIAAKGSGEEIRYGLAGTEPILRALEEYFGTEYPYEKLDLIAAPDYAFGAMENPGAIVYREYLMLLNEGSPLSQKRAYNRVHSHELAHQWFGNLVTPVWWEDIWLNEAFATWMGNKGTHLAYPDGNYDRLTLNAALGAMNIDSLSTTRRVREPLARSENVMDQFDGITYRKGGGVLSMFESFVGVEAFQKGVRLHMDRYADDVATGDDFFQSIADGSGNADVVDAMKSFVDQPGVPLVKITVDCGSDGNCKKPNFPVQQLRYSPLGSKIEQGQSWQIPLCVKAGYGPESNTQKFCDLIKDNSGEIVGPLAGQPAWIMPNADGAGYYRFTLDTAGWAALIANIDQLNTNEVLSTQDSLVAAYRAGEVESSVFLDGMSAFAAHPEYDVASGSTRLIGFMRSELGDVDADVARYVRGNYADRYARIAGTDSVEGQLLAPTLAGLLVRAGGDTDLRDDFIAKGAAYLGLDGAAQTDVVAQNMLSRALREVMRARPEDARAPLLALVKSGSSFEKGAAVGALGQTTDRDIAAELREAALTDTATMTGRQALSLLSVMMGNDALADDTWAWVQANFSEFVTTRVPDVRKGGLPGLASGFCSAGERDAVETFFTANADVIPGYERSLAQTLESIELCAALNSEKGEELATALKSR